jgi:AAA+ ATPase superfamily predicted ATPase
MLLQRENECLYLETSFNRSSSSLCFIFGAQQIGKTSLIQTYIGKKKSLYFCFNEMLQSLQFKHLTHNQCDDFDGFLHLLSGLHFTQKTIIVLEDFHHLVKLDKQNFLVLLHHWNTTLCKLNIQLLITSSTDSFYKMAQTQNSIESLYLKPLDFRVIKSIIATNDTYLQLCIYATFGTHVPYLKQYDLSKSFYENIKTIFLNPQLQHFQAPLHALKSFTNDIATYSSILYAIACGHTKIGQIAQFLNVKPSYLTRYLQTLIEHMIIEKKVPLLEDKSKSKNGRYEFCSFYMKFWFAYIYANLSYVNHHKKDEIIQLIQQNFKSTLLLNSYKAYILTLIQSNSKAFLNYEATHIGSWWNHHGNHIDVIACNQTHISFMNCKLQNTQQAMFFKEELMKNALEFKTDLKKQYGIFLL